MREDKKIATFVAGEIIKSLTKGKKKGSIPVKQSHYGNQDWRLAIGGMTLDWQLKKKGIAQISFRNKYQWGPNEKRITQCVHKAAEDLKKSAKAKEYWMVGAPAPFDFKAMSKKGASGNW